MNKKIILGLALLIGLNQSFAESLNRSEFLNVKFGNDIKPGDYYAKADKAEYGKLHIWTEFDEEGNRYSYYQRSEMNCLFVNIKQLDKNKYDVAAKCGLEESVEKTTMLLEFKDGMTILQHTHGYLADNPSFLKKEIYDGFDPYQ
jgi:hypothetical protein